MAQIIDASLSNGKRKTKAHHIVIDMTPLVDLAFLLITFFIFTTTLQAKRVTTLIVPMTGPPLSIMQKHAVTALICGNNKILVYPGLWDDAIHGNLIKEMNYNEKTGLGNFIRLQQNNLVKQNEDRASLVLLIKPLDGSTYKNLVDVLDETTINGVKNYAVVDPTPNEIQFASKKF